MKQSSPMSDQSSASTQASIWRSEIMLRIRCLWLTKMLTTMFGITIFLIIYLWILRHPLFAVTIMPLTALDRMVEFQPITLPLYLSLWVYVSIGPALLKNSQELMLYGIATLLMSVVGLTIFIVWPTAVPKFVINWDQYPSISMLKDLDMAANACPSMHVAFAVFTVIWLGHILRQIQSGKWLHVLNWLWCLGITYSTVATHQHVMLDVLGGAILGAVSATLILRVLKSADQSAAQYVRHHKGA